MQPIHQAIFTGIANDCCQVGRGTISMHTHGYSHITCEAEIKTKSMLTLQADRQGSLGLLSLAGEEGLKRGRPHDASSC